MSVRGVLLDTSGADNGRRLSGLPQPVRRLSCSWGGLAVRLRDALLLASMEEKEQGRVPKQRSVAKQLVLLGGLALW